MSKLYINITKIIHESDFKKIEKNGDQYVQLLKSFDMSIENSWQKRMDFKRPGLAPDGTKVLDVYFRLDDQNPSFDPADPNLFAVACASALSKVFKGENLLSCFFKKGSPECWVSVFPLDNRRLNPEKWLDQRHEDKFNFDITVYIEKFIRSEIAPDLFVTGESTGNSMKDLGYSDSLIKFQAPEYQEEDFKVLNYDTPETDTQIQTQMPYDKMREVTLEVLKFFTNGPEKTRYERALRGDDERPSDVIEAVKQHIRQNKKTYGEISDKDIDIIAKRLYNAMFQNYILDPLINDRNISDIKVLSPYDIRVKAKGNRFTSNLKFMDGNDYWRFIKGIAERSHLDIKSNAVNVFSDVDSNPNFRLRVNITTPYINSVRWPYLHIRKISKQKIGMDYLLKAQMLDEKIKDYLIYKARTGKGMIFTGKGASGKTTLMNCLLDYIPFNKSGLVIQESNELFSDVHPDLMFQTVQVNVGKGMPVYTLEDLARNGLLTDLDYFIIGEVKGAEAKYFINAADTGHRCWCSVHSPSSTDAIDKLADYVMYSTKYSKEEATYMLKDLGTVIFMKNFKVCEISEITGWDDEKKMLKYSLIYRRPGVMDI